MAPAAHTVVTDSGLGGLAVCAALERGRRQSGHAGPVRLTYVNAWPFDDRGYNDLADVPARARVFDAALARIEALQPDRIVIACNTLSVLYQYTSFSRRAAVPVRGIVEAGVAWFAERLRADAGASIVLVGTKTTIESGVHRDGLVSRGIDAARIAAVPCHGLAAAIERDVNGPRAAELLAACADRAASAAAPGGTLYVGLCCTHYGYVAERFADALAARSGRTVVALDPNARLVESLLADDAITEAGGPGVISGDAGAARDGPGVVDRDAGAARDGGAPDGATLGAEGPRGDVRVRVLSKVELSETARMAFARLVEPVSPATASALLSYARIPDFF